MSEDLDVIKDEESVSRTPQGLAETRVYNFFDRDPYTRRHRSRSIIGVIDPLHLTGTIKSAINTGNTSGAGGFPHSSSVASNLSTHGLARLGSAEL